MHRRFAGARTICVTAGGSQVEAVVADSYKLRLFGLTGIDEDEFEPLLFPRCRSIHTFGMRAPIDVVWLDEEGGIFGVVEQLHPRRHARAPRAGRRLSVAALELAPGYAERLGFRTSAMPPNP
jgi:uncharacterized membrane protein (UPF0127 family)